MTQPDKPELIVDDGDGVRTLTLNRPERLNALTSGLRLAIEAAVKDFDSDDSLRVLVVTGAGRGFCSGSDLSAGHDVPPALSVRDQARLRFGWHLPLDRTDKPTIAAVNGVAAGGGIGLALSCDIVLASTASSFVPAFAGLGLSADNGLGQTLVSRMGYGRALRFLLQGKRASPDEALAVGLVDGVFEESAFSAEVRAVAEEIAATSPIATMLTKRLLKDAPSLPRHVELAYEELFLSFTRNSQRSGEAQNERL